MGKSAFVGANLTGGAISKAAPKLLAIYFYGKPTIQEGLRNCWFVVYNCFLEPS